jgi:hypothetical protein
MTVQEFFEKQFAGAERRQFTRYGRFGANPLTLWIMKFSAQHVIVGSILQSLLVLAPFFVVLSLITGFNNNSFVLPLCGGMLVALLAWGIPYNRWRKRREPFGESGNRDV